MRQQIARDIEMMNAADAFRAAKPARACPYSIADEAKWPCALGSILGLVLPGLIILSLAGCTGATRSYPEVPPPVLVHTVLPGDSLGMIARTYTGSIDQWRAIAEHNGIDNPKQLAVGTQLTIPESLLSWQELVPESRAPDSAFAITPSAPETVASPLPAARTLQERDPVVTESADVVLTPVNKNRQFELQPITQSGTTRLAGNRQVKVLGTYYPKGIYIEPDVASRVIMRLAPGTRLELQRQYPGWYKVVTTAGEGYLRVSDGTIEGS